MPSDVSNNELENEQSINYATTLLLFLWRDQKICVKQEKSYFPLAQTETSIWTSFRDIILVFIYNATI